MTITGGVQCFFIEPTRYVDRFLRRYSSGNRNCTGPMSYHNAQNFIERVEDTDDVINAIDPEIYTNDPRWPATCTCGYAFTDSDERQVFPERVYRRTDTSLDLHLHDAPMGAMWYADWYIDHGQSTHFHAGPDGHCLVVKCPDGHDWVVDSQASNCTRPGEIHECWCRHGQVPNITVDKIPNPGMTTCQAGGGSIQTGTWHGFLRNGVFVSC